VALDALATARNRVRVAGPRTVECPLLPTAGQIRKIRAVIRWYLGAYYKTPDDPGVAATFCSQEKLGGFAVREVDLARRDGAALFRTLIATTMFQRQRDEQVIAILRSIPERDAYEIGAQGQLLHLAEASGCAYASGVDSLRTQCDLRKDARKKGTCSANPSVGCAMKRHTVLLRRYGHFGKVPTSAALVVKEAGVQDLAELLGQVRRSVRGPERRARALISALSRGWRVNEKIASMFLSLVLNPDLAVGGEEWRDVDWRHFVVIDSNVDLFLARIGYSGLQTYEARRQFIRAASREIDLRLMRRGLRRDNPRIVQQAMYLFMSASNRRANSRDCMHNAPANCARCPGDLASICPVRRDQQRRRLPVLEPS
jgi:hypothetical protein